MPAFGEQEPADLRDVRAGGDVDVVVLIVRFERVAAQEIVQRRIDAIEIPGIGQVGAVPPQRGPGRNLREIVRHRLREPVVATLVGQPFETVDPPSPRQCRQLPQLQPRRRTGDEPQPGEEADQP